MWGGAPNKYLDKIDKCIKHSMDTKKLLHWKFMWKLLAKKTSRLYSIIEQFLLHFNEAINNTNREKLIISYYRTSIGKNSVCQGCKIWNLGISAHIKSKESYNNFA